MKNTPGLEEKLKESLKRQQELELQVEDLTDFIESASIPLHWVNGSGVIIWANQAELDLLGYAKDEYIGKHISNFHANKSVCNDILTRLINKETLTNYPANLITRNGNSIPVVITSNVRWQGDKFIHTRCYTRDVSDLRKLEEEKVSLINQLQVENLALKEQIRALKQRLDSVV
jgi:two-component system, OmpR family, sensor histidine kinase VicK